ncbi:TMEM56 [Branchiostoma lanceolatum]|uniref:TMEM56 protein n=1 Tax=Branchiostoma lanceolatum TaxID=7740 RepID=A0A8K0E7I4_BRALA|nr:TMEM56 [Branchiostoma lanceolatum]
MVSAVPVDSIEPVYLVTFLATIAVCLSIFKFVAPWVLRRVTKKYDSLPRAKKVELNEIVMALAHSLVVGLASWCVYFTMDDIKPSLTRYNSPPVLFIDSIFFGFSVSDLILLLVYRSFGLPFIIHHLMAAFNGYVVLAYRSMPYYCLTGMMMELSGPCTNSRFLLKALDIDQTSSLYVGNSVAMLTSFVAIRITANALNLYHLLWLASTTDDFYQLSLAEYVCYVGGVFTFSVLNCLWLSKMIKGAIRLWRGVKKYD